MPARAPAEGKPNESPNKTGFMMTRKQETSLTTQRLIHPREVSSMKLRNPLRRTTEFMFISVTSGTTSVSSVQASTRRADDRDCLRLGRLAVETSDDTTLRLSLDKQRPGLYTDTFHQAQPVKILGVGNDDLSHHKSKRNQHASVQLVGGVA